MNEAIKNLLERRSCRVYTGEQVKEEDLEIILKAGTYAPTARGLQSPIIAVIQDPEKLRSVEKLNAEVMGNPDDHPFYGAPTLVVVFADTSLSYGFADANLVMGNILNAAYAVGVDSCYIWRANEVFESEEGKALKKEWNIPERYQGAGNIILVYGKPEGRREAPPRKEDYVIRI